MDSLSKETAIALIISCLVIISSFTAISAQAANSAVEVNADLAINSKYIWRGILLDDDPVMQPGIYLSSKGFTASIWGSFDIDSDDSLNSDEVDYSIDYTHQFENFSLSLGHTYYDFPPADAKSREFYLGISLDSFLAPDLTWYHDYGDEDSGGGDGDYVVFNLSHSIPLADSAISLDLSGHVGYNNELFINGDGGDIAIGTGLTIPLTEKMSFSPNINYSIPLGDVEDAYNNEFCGGCTLAFGF